MEIRLVVFLFFVFVAVTTNTLLVWFAYKAFANLTAKATEAIADFKMNDETHQWFDSLQVASAQALAATESAKKAMVDFEPTIIAAQENYSRALADVDSHMERAAEEITIGARKLRDIVAKPAFSVMAFAAGLTKVLENLEDEE
jgi:membrane-anchored protein YejM (alkaline phosphatase superfamily)